MKTNKKTSLAATKTTPGLSGFHRPNKHYGPLAAVILLLGALQLQVFVPTVLAESSTDGKSGGAQPWSVQVDRVDPGDVGLDPSFGAAIYENLLEELTKTDQFKQVFRSGDRNANDVPGLLLLKTTVQKYTPGSETRRAVTTVTGATKLNVRVQLFTREGQLLLEHAVSGGVRFIRNNLRATHNLAHNIAKTLNHSASPDPPGPVPEKETGKMSAYQAGTTGAVKYRQAARATETVHPGYQH